LLKTRGDVRPAGLVLGIETATVLGGVALVSGDGHLLGEVSLLNSESHAERILPAAAWLLATLGLSAGELAAIAVSRGPGSFTGLRAGVATAKGLAFSLGVPLFGISTLDALAAGAAPGAGTVCAVFGARRGEVFSALFHAGSRGPDRLGPDRLQPYRAFADELPPDCLVVGELPPALAALLPVGGTVRFAPTHLAHPRAAVIAALGGVARAASRPSELESLLPHYLRPCDAVALAARS
jgi:tRNA threonylcarbamoyladenosine biosynthesis protein TsaB